jgi:hypothetical protein
MCEENTSGGQNNKDLKEKAMPVTRKLAMLTLPRTIYK